jgi:hypothetical protein
MLYEAFFLIQQIVSHVIGGKNTVVGMDTLVNQSRYGYEQLRFRQCPLQFTQILIDTGCHTETDAALISQKSGLHVQQVIIRGFLIVGYVAFQLELLRFQIVARVVFVRNGERNDIQFLKIGDNVVQVASDKQVNFSRASTATYINKSGELKTAEINEPRFECDGLLIEGQRTNFFQNSTDPSKWNKSTSLDVTETGTDSFGFNYGRFVVQDSIVGTSKAHTIIGLYSSTGGVDTSGDEKHVTISCRVKSEVDNIAVRILFEHYDGEVRTSIGAANLNLTTRIISKTGQTSRVTARSVKDDATGWIFFEATLKADTTENTVGGFVQYSPDTGQMVASGDYLDVTTPQIEAGTGTSSFIVTGTTPATRASDMVTVPIKNNLYNLPFTVLCEVHKNWYKTPNVAPRVFDTGGHQTGAGIVMGFGSSGGYDGFPYCDIGGSDRRINENAGLEKMLIGMRVKSERSTCVVSNGKLSSETKTKWEYIRSTATIRIGGQTTAGLRHLFGHVRNFRLWHKELTDAQLGEVVE